MKRAHMAGVAATGIAGLLTFPDLVGLDRLGPIAQLVALRPHVVVGEFVAAGAIALASTRRRRWLPLAAGVAIVAVLGGALLAPRTIAGPAPTQLSGRALTVLSFNVYEGRADLGALTEVLRRERPDLVSLPEAGADFRARLAPLVEPMGYRSWSSTPPGSADVLGVTALAAAHLGEVTARVDESTRFPTLELSGGELGARRFVAFHSVAPVSGGARLWRADLAQLPRWCAGSAPVIVAGDFNATLDHSVLRAAMRGCSDAGASRGSGLVPTWGPDASIRTIGIQIDHVLATAGTTTESFVVLDLPGSDHRAVLTRLRPASSGPGAGSPARAFTQHPSEPSR